MNLPRSLYNTNSEIETYCKDIDLLALDFRESLHERTAIDTYIGGINHSVPLLFPSP